MYPIKEFELTHTICPMTPAAKTATRKQQMHIINWWNCTFKQPWQCSPWLKWVIPTNVSMEAILICGRNCRFNHTNMRTSCTLQASFPANWTISPSSMVHVDACFLPLFDARCQRKKHTILQWRSKTALKGITSTHLASLVCCPWCHGHKNFCTTSR